MLRQIEVSTVEIRTISESWAQTRHPTRHSVRGFSPPESGPVRREKGFSVLALEIDTTFEVIKGGVVVNEGQDVRSESGSAIMGGKDLDCGSAELSLNLLGGRVVTSPYSLT
jgi:hypothetical protein